MDEARPRPAEEVGVPHHATVMDAVFGDLDGRRPLAVAELADLRAALTAGLQPVASSLGVDELRVDRHRLRAALAGEAIGDGGFAWAPRLAARALGLPALSWMLRTGHCPADAVAAAADEARRTGASLGEWLEVSDAPTLAATTAAALSWVSRALVAVPWPRLGRVQWCFGTMWTRPLGAATPIALCGRPDAAVLVTGDGSPARRVMLELGDPPPAVLRLDALAATLAYRRAPVRVVAVDPASGLAHRVEVDAPLLERSVAEAITAATTLARAAVAAA